MSQSLEESITATAAPCASNEQKSDAGAPQAASIAILPNPAFERIPSSLIFENNPFDLLLIEERHMGEDWLNIFKPELDSVWFKALKKKLAQDFANGQPIYPKIHDIYSFTRLKMADIKVVILGQDPYHGENQAHGLCFSVNKGIALPPSLKNIYKELKNDVDGWELPSHGNLESWQGQGVLLLNASLTVRKSTPNSHSKYGWALFTDAVIKHIDSKYEGVVFMLWGGFARKKAGFVCKKKHLVLTAAHPSPLGANKGGWFGESHFSKCNAYLTLKGKQPILWDV